MTKVAIIIVTMNRPDFLLRQFEFYEQMDSPHPVYISDSSNPENAEKIKNGIKKFKNFNIIYQWAEPGKDCSYQLMPLIKEKYCMRMGDEDIIIPKTISECADFLENNPDYATCAGRQVNIRFRKQDYSKPYGIIEKQTILQSISIEDEKMSVRVKKFWFDEFFFFICYAVTRVEIEKEMRNVTKHFSLTEDMLEFLILSILLISGKAKVIDKLGYIMQVSDLRSFDHSLLFDFMLSPSLNEKWGLCGKEFSQIIRKTGASEEESVIIAKGLFIHYLAAHHPIEPGWLSSGQKESAPTRQSIFKKLRHFASNTPFLKSIYYKFTPPNYVDRPESKYFNDFKIVKDFLEKN